VNASASGGLRGLSYASARRLLIAGGLVVLLLTAGVMYARRVDTVEVVAVLLFAPVFVALVFWNVVGGLVGAVLAALAYLLLRLDAIDQVGLDQFRGHLVSRTVAYLAFGVIGGWANRELEGSLTKLDLYDQIDDDTGLHNARFLVQDTELEMARSTRYQTIFSLVIVDVPAASLDALSRRQRAAALKGLGRVLSDSIRTVDRAAHSRDESRHRFVVVLPETGAEGARVFGSRLRQWVIDYLSQRGADGIDGSISVSNLTFPGNEIEIRQLREEFAAIDREEHPEAAELAAEAEAEPEG
jgi:GGDEF domain-containing protein